MASTTATPIIATTYCIKTWNPAENSPLFLTGRYVGTGTGMGLAVTVSEEE